MLYLWELSGADLGEVVGRYPDVGVDGEGTANAGRGLDEEGRRLAADFVRGVATRLDRIDPLIAEEAQHWRLERMPVLDRLVLRLGAYELLATDTPRAIVIDEALELARRFSGEQAVKFVNGVLDAVARRLSDGGPGAAS
jgi:N utilization substance protein B